MKACKLFCLGVKSQSDDTGTRGGDAGVEGWVVKELGAFIIQEIKGLEKKALIGSGGARR